MRPAVVLSVPIEETDRALVTLVPHTTSVRGTRFEVPLPIRFLRPGGFDAQSLVTVPTVKLIRRLGRLNEQQLVAVEARVSTWLGFPASSEGQG